MQNADGTRPYRLLGIHRADTTSPETLDLPLDKPPRLVYNVITE